MKKKVGNTPMDAALKYLTSKPRTIREMERHLDSCNYGEFEVYQVVERLKELDYLNDEKYAEEFVRSRLASKPVSRRKLYQQMATHELPREIIEAALEGVDDGCEQESAREVAEKFSRQLAELPEEERRDRVLRRLAGRGYDFDVARAAWDSLQDEE